jgi:hypothetical protein
MNNTTTRPDQRSVSKYNNKFGSTYSSVNVVFNESVSHSKTGINQTNANTVSMNHWTTKPRVNRPMFPLAVNVTNRSKGVPHCTNRFTPLINFEASPSVNSETYKLCLWNAQSLKRKVHLLLDYMAAQEIDVYFIVESWLNSYDQPIIGELCNDGLYRLISKPRKDRTGGGLSCLYK